MYHLQNCCARTVCFRRGEGSRCAGNTVQAAASHRRCRRNSRGLLVPHEQFQQFANDQRACKTGGTRTPREAARQLECNPSSIRSLVDLKLLKGQQTRRGLRVTEESIEEFKKHYVAIASIVKVLQSCSRGLIGFCKKCDSRLWLQELGAGIITKRSFARRRGRSFFVFDRRECSGHERSVGMSHDATKPGGFICFIPNATCPAKQPRSGMPLLARGPPQMSETMPACLRKTGSFLENPPAIDPDK